MRLTWRSLRERWLHPEREQRRALGTAFQSAYLAAKKTNDPTLAPFHSQYGQDQWLATVCFPDLKEGTFVDIGANDGLTLSNTHYFEQVRGWRGLCVEPIPGVCAQLRDNRRCIIENCGIAANSGSLPFTHVSGPCEMLSGFSASMSSRRKRRIQRDVARYGGTITQLDIPSEPAAELFSRHGLSHIDYCNIDVEGGELGVLTTIDFSRVSITAMSIENDYFDERIYTFLADHGFVLITKLGDDLFVHRDHCSTLAAPWRPLP